jgi:hypothetical protein
MADVCEFHKQTMDKVDATHSALEGKIAKSSLKWLAAIFAMPTIGALLFAWSFMASADYRYGSYQQARTNEAKIALLEERTVNIRAELVKAQTDIMNDLTEIKKDIKFLTMKYRDK